MINHDSTTITNINASELKPVTLAFLQKQVRPEFKEFAGTAKVWDIDDILEEMMGENNPSPDLQSDIEDIENACKENLARLVKINFEF